MILKKLIIDNYGLYRGQTTFDLAPKENSEKGGPVILFGGQNGAGKTTLFETFKVLLYGKGAFGKKVSEAKYKSILRSKIHRATNAVLKTQRASIALEFEHVTSGEYHTIFAQRAWTMNGGDGVVETLTIYRDGEQIHEVTNEFWQGFVEEIIPFRLSSLFFFDGEKIKSIADDENGNEALADSIKTLLGLDIVERLKSDLSIYRSRQAQLFSDTEFNLAITAYEKDITEARLEIEMLKEDLASLQTKIDGVNSTISNKEKTLQKEGHVFAQQRENLVKRKAEIIQSLEETRKSAKEAYESLYPFALCPSVTEGLLKQIELDKKARHVEIIEKELRELEATLLDRLSDTSKTALSIVSKVVNETISNYLQAGLTDAFGLSDKDTALMTSWINRANSEVKPLIGVLSEQVEALTGELRKVENEILKAPNDSVLRPLIEDLNESNKRLGSLQHSYSNKENKLRLTGNKLEEAKRNLDKTVAQFKSNDDTGKRIELAGRIQTAMTDYSDKLTRAKVEELRTTVAECFNRISRKEGLVNKIEIDPETFAVTLFDRYGNALPKEELSAGEKQMYAVAMLWGLSKTSGRPLPVIIDTPLGRLDSEHRGNLVRNYFPHAAEQVLILSTDTEIDQQWYEELGPHISRSYHLEYDHETNSTQARDRYFWR